MNLLASFMGVLLVVATGLAFLWLIRRPPG